MSGKPAVAISCCFVLIVVTYFACTTNGEIFFNDKGKPFSTKMQRCEEVVHIMEDEDDPKLSEQKFEVAWKPNATECTRLIQGDDNCAVSLSCVIDIPSKIEGGTKCGREFIRVTDGANGFKIYCGNTSFKDLRATKNLRDLFIKFEIGTKKPHKHIVQKPVDRKKSLQKAMKLMANRTEDQYKGISCVAKCVKKRDEPGGRRLPKNMLRMKNSKCFCGLHNEKEAKINEIPWQAAVVAPGTRNPTCGAAIINDQFILTAAHCFWFKKQQPKDIEVIVHAYNLSQVTDKDENTQRFKVVELITHPLFDQEFDYDYALLRLESKINFTNQEAPVSPVCLPTADTWNTLMKSWDGETMQVSGWNVADEKATTRVFQKLDVPYVQFKECVPLIKKYDLSSRMICAGFLDPNEKKDSCKADSGSPLTVKSPKNPEVSWQVGVASFGENCTKGSPRVYSRVTDAIQWIMFHTEQAEAPSTWCDESTN